MLFAELENDNILVILLCSWKTIASLYSSWLDGSSEVIFEYNSCYDVNDSFFFIVERYES